MLGTEAPQKGESGRCFRAVGGSANASQPQNVELKFSTSVLNVVGSLRCVLVTIKGSDKMVSIDPS